MMTYKLSLTYQTVKNKRAEAIHPSFEPIYKDAIASPHKTNVTMKVEVKPVNTDYLSTLVDKAITLTCVATQLVNKPKGLKLS